MWQLVKKILKFILYIFLAFIVTSTFCALLYKFVNPPVTPLMVMRLGEQNFSGQALKLKKEWVPLENIAPSLQLAVVASEDNRFLEHHGFDLDAIDKAKEYNSLHKGKKIRGASTISQQTAKNVFLWPQRSWLRKGLEVYFTFLIELTWSKKRIMEVYLNVIETGKGIYGVEAAASAYFNKHAISLTRTESALLAAVLPNPQKWDPRYPTAYIQSRKEWILWNMENIGKLDY
ncbi:MAG: monofunctional biosynthetic peptidoglycan transglycosylase [Bacteroidetes bacterium]|nr:monofunctional biosynthetic peptidoglycan transglycosylase [Bacteroidota bacterium]